MNGHQKQKEQSARMIEDALFDLMHEKEFEKITVSEIVKRADVARRTFYRLYGAKEDVLHGYFAKLCGNYKCMYPALKTYDVRQVAEDFFGFWYMHRELLLLLHKCGLEEMLYGRIRRVSAEVVGNRVEDGALKSDEELKYFACYSTGGFLMLLDCWIRDGMKEKPEEYAGKVSRILLKFIRERDDPADKKGGGRIDREK